MNKIYFKLAKTNITNNKSLYFPYILSGIITVAMFYLIMFLNNNSGVDDIPGSKSVAAILGIGVVVIAIFAYIFLFYTNSFIIHRRKKEIGIYNILGMEKRHIAKVLAIETIFVAIISIVLGLAIGIGFSKLMLMLLYRILGFKESISFNITGQGIQMTLGVFGILYVLTLIYNLMKIKLTNPIGLLRGSSQGEKEPKTKMLMTFVGVISLATAYFIAITTKNPIEMISLFLLAVILVIIGTFCLFTAGSILILKILRKNKKFYYNKRHFIAVSGMIYRMKQNAAGLASICILSTMVLVMVSTTVSMFAGINDEITSVFPRELCITIEHDTAQVDFDKIKEKSYGLVEEQGRNISNKSAYSYFYVLTNMENNNFTLKEDMYYDEETAIIYVLTRESLINMGEGLNENNVPKINKGSVLVYADNNFNAKEIKLFDEKLKVEKCEEYSFKQDVYMKGMVKGTYYIVVDGEEMENKLFEILRLKNIENIKYTSIVSMDIDGTKEERLDCAKTLREKLLPGDFQNPRELSIGSKTENEDEFYAVYGGLFFLGLFLGSMFLMVTVMIIFYKQISEGFDDKERYMIMEKVGMSDEEVKMSIKAQVRMVFFLPILMAVIHVLAAFPMIKRMLALLNLTNSKLFILCLAATVAIFTLIYYLVFKMTSKAYGKIVGNQIR